MNTKLLVLLTVTLGAQSAFGAALFDVKRPTDKITGYMTQAVDIVKPVYDANWPKALEIYTYTIDNRDPQIGYILDNGAQLISRILQNEKMRNLLNTIYEIDITELANLLMLGNAVTIPPLAMNFAKTTLGFDNATAMQFSNALVDLAVWMQDLYNNVYVPQIKGKLDDIFKTQDKMAIENKLNALLASSEVRAIVLGGLENIKKNWVFISKKLGEFGFDARTAESIVDKLYAVAKTINDQIEMMPVSGPSMPNIPGIDW